MTSDKTISKSKSTQDPPVLTAQEARRVFDYSPITGLVTWRVRPSFKITVGDEVGHINGEGYRMTKIKKKDYSVHRLCWLIHYGVWPKNQIDHINGDRADNRIINLRDVLPRTNATNQKCHRKGRLPGTYFDKIMSKWRAQIYVNKRIKYLGSYPTELEAHKAYLKAVETLL